jgi:predicted metal-dependent hydrolase
MAVPLPNTRLPGTRSTEVVRDAGQLDFFRSLWTRVTGTPPAPKPASRAVTGGSAAVAPAGNSEVLTLPAGEVTITYIRHPRARRYRLVFRRDGTARCTIPRRGTMAEARRFVAENEAWLTDVMRRRQQAPPTSGALKAGDAVPFAGVPTPIRRVEIISSAADEPDPDGDDVRLGVGPVQFTASASAPDLRPIVERALLGYATKHLPGLVTKLAAKHGFTEKVRRVSVRNQRTRWGSCSRRGVISLNWRLVQLPESVRDYVILHELAHLQHLNHSRRFWAEVERLCPEYRAAEAWLREHGRLFL